MMPTTTPDKASQKTRRNLIIGTGEGILAMPWNFLSVPGNFIIAALLTQHFGLNKEVYGLLVSLPLWANASQILLLPWLARFLTPKDLTLGMGWLNVGMWTMLAAVLPFLEKAGAQQVAGLFLVFFVVASLSQALVGVGWTSWVRDWVPRLVRGHYFGVRNRWLGVGTLFFLVLALALFEMDEAALWPFQFLIVTAVLGRYASLIWQHGIRTAGDHLDVVGPGWIFQLGQNLSAPGLVRFIIFAAWMSFWMGFTGPFLPVFVFEELAVPPGTFSIFILLATSSGILGWWFWGQRVDRWGCLPVLVTSVLVWETQNLLWLVVDRENAWMLYPMWAFGGFACVGYFAASFNLLLKLIHPQAKVLGVSLHLTVTSLAGAIAPILVGYLLTRFLGEGSNLEVYRFGFAVKSAAIFLGLWLLRGVKEPLKSGPNSGAGAFRSIRQLLAAQGASFLGRGG